MGSLFVDKPCGGSTIASHTLHVVVITVTLMKICVPSGSYQAKSAESHEKFNELKVDGHKNLHEKSVHHHLSPVMKIGQRDADS